MEAKRILFLSACPHNSVRIRFDEEHRTIDEVLRLTRFGSQFKVEVSSALRVRDLSDVLQRYEPHIVHFSGHGTPDGEIVLEGNDGKSTTVPPLELTKLFQVCRGSIKCVVLNACYTEAQAEGIAEAIGCVIGMSREVYDNAAIVFARGFYKGIGYGRSLQAAFDLGRIEVGLERQIGSDTPSISTRKGVDPETVFIVGEPIQHAPISNGESDAHRHADLIVARKVWELINSEYITSLEYGVQTASIDREPYWDHIGDYLRLRQYRPEFSFNDAQVSEALMLVDAALARFHNHLMTTASSELQGEKRFIVPHFKQHFLPRDIYEMKLDEYHQIVENMTDVREAHDHLVRVIKQRLPEFDFPDSY